MKQLTSDQWKSTPYAGSDAKHSDAAITNLLNKYQIDERQWTEHKGEHGRPAITLAFTAKGKTYRVTIETLDAPTIEVSKRVLQVKRTMFWTLKPLLESAYIFGPDDDDGMERLLLPFLVDNTGTTTFERLKPYLSEVTSRALIECGSKMALPAPRT